MKDNGSRFSHWYPQVTGATSSLGRCLAVEFARCGCTIVCVDNDLESVRKTAYELSGNYTAIQSVGPDHRKHDVSEFKAIKAFAYQCNLQDRNSIRGIAKKIQTEIGKIDVLVTCAGNPGQDIFDTVSTTLMSHYWVS